MLVIGLTGGIGTGKSTVAAQLASLGAAVIDADQLVHEGYAQDDPLRQAIVDAFGRTCSMQMGALTGARWGNGCSSSRKRCSASTGLSIPGFMAEYRSALQRWMQRGRRS